MIRILDIILSFLGLIVLGFFLPAIWILLRLDSKGPLFYLADRVGKDQKPFKMFKFRTMLDTPVQVGECLCPQFDPRVTRFGHFLRRTKINELPQMINILKGDMSFVGPRPEAPELAEVYPKEAKIVFSVKPGLVGPATIHGRNEEECYPVGVDVKQYYLDHLLPGKIKLDSEFIQKHGFANYLKFFLLGVAKTISGVLGSRQIQSNQPQLYLLIVDLLLITGAYLFAYNFFIWQATGVFEIIHSTRYLPIVIVVRLLCNQYFGLYRPLLKYLSNYDIFETVKANSCGTAFLFLIAFLFEKQSYSLLIGSLDWLVLNLSSAGLRLALMLYFQQKNQMNKESTKSRVLIFGVCDEGNHACRSLISGNRDGYEVVGFIDDVAHNYGKTIYRKKVLGNRYSIKDLAILYHIDQVLIKERYLSEKELLEIVGLCVENKLKCGVLSNTNGFSSNYMNTSTIRDIEISDILPSDKIYINADEVKSFILGKTILINGSGGVMGIELCKNLINLGCRKLIVIERYESYLNEFCLSIFKENLCTLIVPVLLESEKDEMLEATFLEHRPNIVIQAGLRKFESIYGIKANNIENINHSKNYYLAKLAAKYNCEKFVMISTIYAKNPKNLIDESLREAEKFLEDFFLNTNTRLIIVPMCDIAESQGGIVSVIETQVKRRETVNIPIQYERTLVVSKEQAAKIIFQYMVEEKKELIEQKIFCDNNSPVFLTDIVQKLAALYGLKLSNKSPLIQRNFI